jgi:ceramide synthetase
MSVYQGTARGVIEGELNMFAGLLSVLMCLFISFPPKLAKLANYAKYQRICDTGFVVFSIVFFITRLVIYPFW